MISDNCSQVEVKSIPSPIPPKIKFALTVFSPQLASRRSCSTPTSTLFKNWGRLPKSNTITQMEYHVLPIVTCTSRRATRRNSPSSTAGLVWFHLIIFSTYLLIVLYSLDSYRSEIYRSFLVD